MFTIILRFENVHKITPFKRIITFILNRRNFIQLEKLREIFKISKLSPVRNRNSQDFLWKIYVSLAKKVQQQLIVPFLQLWKQYEENSHRGSITQTLTEHLHSNIIKTESMNFLQIQLHAASAEPRNKENLETKFLEHFSADLRKCPIVSWKLKLKFDKNA